jgi:hypothetical protein
MPEVGGVHHPGADGGEQDPVKDAPEDTALAEDVDLNAIRRVVTAALPA